MHMIKIIFFLLLLTPSFSQGEEHAAHDAATRVTGVESLSPKLRELLTKEMQALEKGMLAIFPAYISGDWGKIEQIANQMKNSFILKQNISEKQADELHAALPRAFIELDQHFHYLSGMLEHVAERKKPELVGFYLSRLGEACVNCHAQYATHKFPAFITKKEHHEH